MLKSVLSVECHCELRSERSCSFGLAGWCPCVRRVSFIVAIARQIGSRTNVIVVMGTIAYSKEPLDETPKSCSLL